MNLPDVILLRQRLLPTHTGPEYRRRMVPVGLIYRLAAYYFRMPDDTIATHYHVWFHNNSLNYPAYDFVSTDDPIVEQISIARQLPILHKQELPKVI